MRYFSTLFIWVACKITLHAQSRWGVNVQVQPQLGFYSGNYAFRWQPQNTNTTVSTGIAANVQYNVSGNFFVFAGAGYINQAFHTTVFLNQGALPPPQRSGTLELVVDHNIYYRIFCLPVGVAYSVITKKHFSAVVLAETQGNFLLNAKYAGVGKYSGTYAKNRWQGYSISPGVGLLQAVKHNISFAFSASYSAVNKVAGDSYLFSQSAYKIPLASHFLQFSAGLRYALPYKH